MLGSQAVRGLLFGDELSQPTAAESAIGIVQYPGEIGQVMD